MKKIISFLIILSLLACNVTAAEDKDRGAFVDIEKEHKGPWPSIDKIIDGIRNIIGRITSEDWKEEDEIAVAVLAEDGFSAKITEEDRKRIERAKASNINPSKENDRTYLYLTSFQEIPNPEEYGYESAVRVDMKVMGKFEEKESEYDSGLFGNYGQIVHIEVYSGKRTLAEEQYERLSFKNREISLVIPLNKKLSHWDREDLRVRVWTNNNPDDSSRGLDEEEKKSFVIIKTQMLPGGTLGIRTEVRGYPHKGEALSGCFYGQPVYFEAYDNKNREIGRSNEVILHFDENGLCDEEIRLNKGVYVASGDRVKIFAYSRGEQVASGEIVIEKF